MTEAADLRVEVADFDGDGLVDTQEGLLYGTDLALFDTDGDGLSAADEVPAGLNPLFADSDRDGDSDDAVSSPGCTAGDNFPSAYNPNQLDSGGGGTTPTVPDGVGDLCQNGDFNGDGRADLLDVTLQRRSLVGLEPDLDPALLPLP